MHLKSKKGHLHWKSSDLKHIQNGKKYSISTTIYIHRDNPEYYLHGNRLQYIQSQNWKQTEAHRRFILGEKLQTVDVNGPKKAWGDLAEKHRFEQCLEVVL